LKFGILHKGKGPEEIDGKLGGWKWTEDGKIFGIIGHGTFQMKNEKNQGGDQGHQLKICQIRHSSMMV